MIEDRKFSFCQKLSEFDIDELIVQCPDCTTFFAACCQHKSFGGALYDPDISVCHNYKIVYTDGACSNNGQSNAKAGLGIAIGDPSDDELSWSITVDDSMDSAPRTSQRAELLAAISGLKKLKEAHHCCLDREHEENPRKSAARRRASAKEDYRATYIVVTDSEYVVKGITEWFPAWRRRGWRKSDGKRPANLDLFMKLDECTTTLEQDRVEVGFWNIPRAYNYIADKLAKEAARV